MCVLDFLFRICLEACQFLIIYLFIYVYFVAESLVIPFGIIYILKTGFRLFFVRLLNVVVFLIHCICAFGINLNLLMLPYALMQINYYVFFLTYVSSEHMLNSLTVKSDTGLFVTFIINRNVLPLGLF